jgi:hypothetical protein
MNTRTSSGLRFGLVILVVAGLAIDAFVHFDLASTFDPVKSSTLSEGNLFRAEAVAATIAGLAVLVRPRRYTAAFAFLVAAAGTAAVLVYQYVDVGAFGPFPDMYDPIWSTEKALSAVAEGIAALAALSLFVLLQLAVRKPDAVRDSSRNAVPATN